MTFYQRLRDINVWMGNADNEGNDRRISPPDVVGEDGGGVLSPDRTQVAYRSDRTGFFEIWALDLRTGIDRQITAMGGPHTDYPRWSPDGSQIAFSSAAGANRDVFIVPARGGPVRRFTTEASSEGNPAWSRDGRWIYFYSTRSGSMQIWRGRTDGSGALQQITWNGGEEGYESHDGKTFYFTRARAIKGVWAVPVDGGDERLLLPDVRFGYWGVAGGGIYFLEIMSHSNQHVVKRYAFRSGQTEQLRSVAVPGETNGFRVSGDGRSILWSQSDRDDDSVMVVDR